MRKCTLFALAVLAAPIWNPILAGYSNVETTTSGFTGNKVRIAIHNPLRGAETVRVRLSVVFRDGSTQDLISPSVTIRGGASASVTLKAARTIVGIGDSPEPIPPKP